MAAILLKNKVGNGLHEYMEGPYSILRMGNGQWYVWLGDKDTGEDFYSLREARKWCKQQDKMVA